MSLVNLFCGLPYSGKSTLARTIAETTGAIHYCLDERMIAKHGLEYDHPDYGKLSRSEKSIIWKEAVGELDQGHDVILDWSLWSRSARKEWVTRIAEHRHEHLLHVFDISLEAIEQRTSLRNETRSFKIPFDEVKRFAEFYEDPESDEKVRINRVHGEA